MCAVVTCVFVYGDALKSDTWTVTVFEALKYRNEILNPIVRPFLGAIGDNAYLVQDNARPHTAYVIQDYLEQESIKTIKLPVRSLDLNCIEHVGHCLQAGFF